MRYFVVQLVFTRGTGDTITMTMPGSGSAAAGLDTMGCLFSSAPHNVVSDPVVSVQCSIIGRNLGIVVADAIPTYP